MNNLMYWAFKQGQKVPAAQCPLCGEPFRMWFRLREYGVWHHLMHEHRRTNEEALDLIHWFLGLHGV